MPTSSRTTSAPAYRPATPTDPTPAAAAAAAAPALAPSTAHIRSLTISPEDARDQSLVLLARGGDQGALAELLTTHQDRVFAVCFRMTGDRDAAEDLAQETLYRVVKNLDQFDSRAKFTTWLTRVAMNVCLTAFRKSRLRRTVSLDAMGGDPSATTMHGSTLGGLFGSLGGRSFLGAIVGRLLGSSAGRAPSGRSGSTGPMPPTYRYGGGPAREPEAPERAELSESLSRLYAALEAIEPEQRAILILRDMQGLDYHHIAEILDVPQGTVKSRIFRARTALREMFESLPPA